MIDLLISNECIEQILAKADIVARRPYSWIKIGNCEITSKKVVFLLFSNQDPTPVCVIKMGRTPADCEWMEGEFAYQSYLWSATTHRPNIAQPIAFLPSDVSPLFVEKWLPGTPLLREYYLGKHIGRDEIVRDTHEIFSQIYFPFINATIDQSRPIDHKAQIIRLLNLVKAECPDLRISREVENLIHDELNSSESWYCPSTGRHGDFWLGNILHHEGTFHLIDWDAYQKSSDPCFDYFHFWVTFSLNYPGSSGSASEKFIHSFLKSNWFIELFRNSSREICTYLHIPPTTSMISMTIYLLEAILTKKDLATRSKEDYETWTGIAQSFFNNLREFKALYSNPSQGSISQ